MDAVTFQTEAMRIEKLLYRVSWSYLKNDADCADAVQEALTRAWEKRNTLKSHDQFKPWLIRILTNQCKDMLRKRRRQSFYPLEEDTAIYPPPGEPSPILEEIDHLTPEQRIVVMLHYVDGYSATEISNMLGLPQGTVKSRLLLARRHLRKTLQVTWEESK